MARKKASVSQAVPVRLRVTREGPPGDISPLMNLLIKRGMRDLAEQARADQFLAEQATPPPASDTLRVFEPE